MKFGGATRTKLRVGYEVGRFTHEQFQTSKHRYIYRIDNLVKASTCNIVGTASIDCQIPLVADVGIFEM
jgi:hypothetical protein